MQISRSTKNTISRANELPGVQPGYYMVRQSDQARFFISEKPCARSLDRAAAKHLSEKVGWDYWIDCSLGLDVHGRIAWHNVDCEDAFDAVAAS